jgi:hypothetical protein
MVAIFSYEKIAWPFFFSFLFPSKKEREKRKTIIPAGWVNYVCGLEGTLS